MNFVRVFINLFQFNRTNWKAVVLCLFAAATFWLFNAFNKNYSTTIQFPLSVEFDTVKYVQVESLPEQVRVNVSGLGWDLFRKSLGFNLPILSLPVEKPAEVKKIVASTLIPEFTSQLGGLKINFIATDTLRLNIDERFQRKFQLSADISGLRFREGYGISGPIKILPDTVTLAGPKKILQKHPDTVVIKVVSGSLRESLKDEFEIPVENKFIQRNPLVATIQVEVSQYKIIETHIPIKSSNLRRTFKLTTPDSVYASFNLPINRLQKLKEKSPVAWLDLNQLKKGVHTLHPNVMGLPPYTTLLKVDSAIVKIY
jgi:YbbR domain-containing protein